MCHVETASKLIASSPTLAPSILLTGKYSNGTENIPIRAGIARALHSEIPRDEVIQWIRLTEVDSINPSLLVPSEKISSPHKLHSPSLKKRKKAAQPVIAAKSAYSLTCFSVIFRINL